MKKKEGKWRFTKKHTAEWRNQTDYFQECQYFPLLSVIVISSPRFPKSSLIQLRQTYGHAWFSELSFLLWNWGRSVPGIHGEAVMTGRGHWTAGAISHIKKPQINNLFRKGTFFAAPRVAQHSRHAGDGSPFTFSLGSRPLAPHLSLWMVLLFFVVKTHTLFFLYDLTR